MIAAVINPADPAVTALLTQLVAADLERWTRPSHVLQLSGVFHGNVLFYTTNTIFI